MLTRFFYLIACVAFVTGAALHPEDTLKDEKIKDPRIIGGKTVDIAKAPYIVSLRYKPITCPECPFVHYCGGSIYDEMTIITAAHCTVGMEAKQFQVAAGTNYRQGSDGVIVPVKEIIMHERYNTVPFDNDIALLILSSPLPLNNFTISTVELGEVDPRGGATAVISGWGALEPGGEAPPLLQMVNAPVVGNEVCSSDYGNNQITESMLCAGLRGIGGKDACQGDAGGPLLVNGRLAGVFSWGYDCGDPTFPGVYAKVSYLRAWILEKIALQKRLK